MNAYASCTIQRATANGRACLRGVVEVEAKDGGWLAFSVFGFTRQEVKDRAYGEADRRATERGWRLDALRSA